MKLTLLLLPALSCPHKNSWSCAWTEHSTRSDEFYFRHFVSCSRGRPRPLLLWHIVFFSFNHLSSKWWFCCQYCCSIGSLLPYLRKLLLFLLTSATLSLLVPSHSSFYYQWNLKIRILYFSATLHLFLLVISSLNCIRHLFLGITRNSESVACKNKKKLCKNFSFSFP